MADWSQHVRDADDEDMLGAVMGLPAQVETARADTADLSLEVPEGVSSVVVAGMGGSAMAGEYAAAWATAARAEGGVPVVVSRGYGLPAWAGEDTLVLAVSYSGNTEETLSALQAGLARGCPVAAVTSGGKLGEFADRSGAPRVTVPTGFQPRAALGHLMVGAARVLEAGGLLEVDAELRGAVKVLRDLQPELALDAPEPENPAKRAAVALRGKVPVVYGAGVLAPAARRWAGQLNENGKALSFHGEMPEMNHNELVGWAGDADPERFSAVLLRHDGEHPQEAERFDFTASLLMERGAAVTEVKGRGDTAISRLLSATMVGDATSVYVAAARGVDPTPVDVIGRLKARVAGTGFVGEVCEELLE